MDQFQMDHQALYHLLKIKCERETLDDILQGMRTLLADEAMPTAEQVRAFLQAPDGDTALDPQQQMVAMDLVVNSVSCADGRKLHQNAADLQRHRQVNDEICMTHGLSVLEPPKKHTRKRQMRPGEYQAGLRGDSWKLDLIQAINEALEYADDRESFIENMEYEGYEVNWVPTRKHITFTCPNGRKCRDSSLHDETFLKENLEKLFAYRQATGFCPGTLEPDEGWMGELAAGLVQLGRALEREADLPQLPTPPVWTDSKLRRREALKKLAMGQKLSHDTDQQQTM